MKFILTLLTTLSLIVSCSQVPNDNANENAKAKLAEKNRETAARNEMVRIIEAAQKLEQEGREMEIYRQYSSPINTAACAKVRAEKSVKMQNLQQQSQSLPENYQSKLVPIYEDLAKCLACDKTAIESCKKARADINQAIRELFPQ
jgi:hypothetical protein